MKNPDAAEFSGRSGKESMKSRNIPMEWMGPASWRLPSGKALAEFALQAGFLAPLLLGNNALGHGPRATASPAARPQGGTKLTKVPR